MIQEQKEQNIINFKILHSLARLVYSFEYEKKINRLSLIFLNTEALDFASLTKTLSTAVVSGM